MTQAVFPQLNGAADPMQQLDPEALRMKVDSRQGSLQPLYTRMDDDYNLWRLTPFNGRKGHNDEGYDKYTSPEPRNYANKIVHWLNVATLLNKIEQTGRPEELRRMDAAKERLAYGMLNSADERLKRRGLPAVRSQMSWQSAIRGPMFARVMLTMDRQGQTVVDITPWDARNVTWDWGGESIPWVCHTMHKTREQIKREYGVDLEPPQNAMNPNLQNDQQSVKVYDYYDDIVNMVFTEDNVVLRAQPHLMPSMPVAYAFGGSTPILSTGSGPSDSNVSDQIKDFSESIFEAYRGVNEANNHALSIGMHLMTAARSQTKKIYSNSGDMALDDDANIPGAEIPLSVADNQDIEFIPPPEITSTALNMTQIIQAQLQQSSLSPVHFGNTPFSLSGFGMRVLQLGAEEKVKPHSEQLASWYQMVVDLLMEQYQTGLFSPMFVKGRDRSGNAFGEVVPPVVAAMGGDIEVSMTPNLPEDELQRIQTAQQLRLPGVDGRPLYDDRWIRDNVMHVQDTENMEDRINMQLAEQTSPIARIYTMMQAALNQGQMELAQIYANEIRLLVFQQMMATQGFVPPLIPGISPPDFGSPMTRMGGGFQESPQGVTSNANPPQATGIQNAPAGQSGPNVPPGTPRPGAQQQNQGATQRTGR